MLLRNISHISQPFIHTYLTHQGSRGCVSVCVGGVCVYWSGEERVSERQAKAMFTHFDDVHIIK